MTTLYVTVHKTSGDICGYGSGAPTHFSDKFETIEIEVPPGAPLHVDSLRQKFDSVTRSLVDKTPVEIALALQPTVIEMSHLVLSELSQTDQHIVPDRPMPESRRQSWIAYRQSLRDLSKPQDAEDPTRRPTPAEMVLAWPVRPDGTDPVQHIRERIG